MNFNALELFCSWPEAADDARTSCSTSSTSASSSTSHGAPSALPGPNTSACPSAHPAHGCCASGGCSAILVWWGWATLTWDMNCRWTWSCRSQKWSPWWQTLRQSRDPFHPSNQRHQSFRLHPRSTVPPLPPLDSSTSTSGFRGRVEWCVCVWEREVASVVLPLQALIA